MTRYVFAGDSVTDCGRTFFAPAVGAGELGSGWVRVVAGELGRREPERHEVLNAGVSGDRVADLVARWDRDVAAHRPDVVTILIGVNDALLDPPTPPDVFEAAFAELLEAARPVGRLIVVEPFVLNVDAATEALRARHLPNLAAVRRLTLDVPGALLVPLDQIMQDACGRAAPEWWAPDGVHPSVAGHALIAEAWLSAVGGVRE